RSPTIRGRLLTAENAARLGNSRTSSGTCARTSVRKCGRPRRSYDSDADHGRALVAPDVHSPEAGPMKRPGMITLFFLAVLLLPSAGFAQKDTRETREASKFIGLAMTKQSPEEQAQMYEQAMEHLRKGM